MKTTQRKQRPMSEAERELIERLREDGVIVTPSTLGPDDPLPPEPLDIPGVTVSDLVIQSRRYE